MSLTYKNLDQTESFTRLQNAVTPKLQQVLSANRVATYTAPISSELTYNYAAMPVNQEIIDLLAKLSDEQQLVEKYEDLLGGSYVNTGEHRMVLHHHTRGTFDTPIVVEGVDKDTFYKEQLQRIKEFVAKVHSGELTGSTGKKFTTVVQIGIGGSDLGPRALFLALKELYPNHPMRAEFISNVDPDDATAVLSTVNVEETLFILVSKSGTTQETLTNCELVQAYAEEQGVKDFVKHLVTVTSETSPLAKPGASLDSFYIDDFIGGRYSSTSAVGGVVLSLALGYEVFAQLVEGAHEADLLARNTDITKNAALLDALIGVYLRNICNLGSTAILPYSQALSRFPAHLQQLDMESNGKRVNRDGKEVALPAGPVIFGEPGTNGQHSFYQLLHQGVDTIPLQFIGFLTPQSGGDKRLGDFTSQQKLNANLVAQIVAFALGQDHENPNKQFPGERYSSLIYGKQLTPKALGALLAHYENKVMFQGFCWNLNSFDQEGVQLGKVLTNKILAGGHGDSVLEAYESILLG